MKKATVHIRTLLDGGTLAPPEEAGWVKKDLLFASTRQPADGNKYLMGNCSSDKPALAEQINDYARVNANQKNDRFA